MLCAVFRKADRSDVQHDSCKGSPTASETARSGAGRLLPARTSSAVVRVRVCNTLQGLRQTVAMKPRRTRWSSSLCLGRDPFSEVEVELSLSLLLLLRGGVRASSCVALLHSLIKAS